MFAKVAPRLFKGDDPGGYVLLDGYVVISDDADLAKRIVADAAKSDLAHDPDYTLDTKDLGDRVVTGWYDLKRAASLPVGGGIAGADSGDRPDAGDVRRAGAARRARAGRQQHRRQGPRRRRSPASSWPRCQPPRSAPSR